jgi:Domain of Unknown Function (DUF1080)
MRWIAAIIVLTGLCAVLVAQDAVSPASPTPLFNGRDLQEWYTYLRDTKHQDPRGVFTVADGMIRISGDGHGYLSTQQAYRDYRLVVEYKWGRRNWGDREKEARDSGVFLHSVGPDGNSFDAGGAYKAAIECQIMQGGVGDILLIKGKYADGSGVPVRASVRARGQRDRDGWLWWKPDGRLVTLDNGGRINWLNKDPGWEDMLDFRGRNDIERPDEWNRVECVCDADRVRIYINDKLVNEADAVFPKQGKILLQCEGSEIFFRRVEIFPLKIARP